MSRIMMTGYSRVLTFAGICLWHHDLFYGPGLHSCPYSDHYLSHNLMRRGNKPNSRHVTRFVSVLSPHLTSRETRNIPSINSGIKVKVYIIRHLPSTILGIREKSMQIFQWSAISSVDISPSKILKNI